MPIQYGPPPWSLPLRFPLASTHNPMAQPVPRTLGPSSNLEWSPWVIGIDVGSEASATKTDPNWALSANVRFTLPLTLYSLQPRAHHSRPSITQVFRRSRAENLPWVFGICPFAFGPENLTTPGSIPLPRHDPSEKVCGSSVVLDSRITYAGCSYFSRNAVLY